MDDGDDFNFVRNQPVDQSIVAHEDFPHFMSPFFGNYSARFWEVGQPSTRVEESTHESVRHQLRVTGYVSADLAKIGTGGAGPSYFDA